MEINEVLKTLKDDYELRNRLRRKNLLVQEELEDEIDDLEQSYITTCVMPQLKSFAQDLLKDLECETYLSILKDADGSIRISNEYDFELPDPSVADEPEVSDEAIAVSSIEEAEDPLPYITRSGSIGFSVKFMDGTIIQRYDAKDTLVESLRKIGFEKASTFKGRMFKGFPLVGKTKRTDGTHKWQEQVGDWYIYTNINNDTKIKLLQMISDDFHLGLQIVKDDKKF